MQIIIDAKDCPFASGYYCKKKRGGEDKHKCILYQYEDKLCPLLHKGQVHPVVMTLLDRIRVCEMERQTAQLSGLDTGWEHPNTQSAWLAVLAVANQALDALSHNQSIHPTEKSG